MADVGDRIEVASTGAARAGVVTAVAGGLITVRWDRGGETSLVPAPGALTVLSSEGQQPDEKRKDKVKDKDKHDKKHDKKKHKDEKKHKSKKQ